MNRLSAFLLGIVIMHAWSHINEFRKEVNTLVDYTDALARSIGRTWR